MRKIFAGLLGISTVALFVASCATTSLVDSWRYSGSAPVTRYHKVLVSSVGRNVNERRVYEDVIAAELRQRGIEATTSFTIMPSDDHDKRQALEQAVKQSGSDAVLSVQIIMIERKTTVDPGSVSGYADFWYPPDFHRWDMYGYFGSRSFYEPARFYSYDVATMQANLFDAASGKLMWAASIETSEPGRVVTVSKEAARIIVQALMKEGLI